MKTRYFAFTALAAFSIFMTSCENDEITVVESPTIMYIETSKIVEFDGMKELANQTNWGWFGKSQMQDIQTLPDEGRLRVRNLIYDEKGVLVQENSVFARSYTNDIKSELMLPNGQYTVVTLTDVVGVDGNENINFRYWQLEDSLKLSTARVVDAGYMGNKYKLLAASVTSVTIDGKSRTYNVTPAPVGSLIFVQYQNIHSYSGLKFVELETKKSSSELTFTEKGTIPNFDVSSDYSWRYSNLEPEDYPNSQNVYGYAFVFASDNTNVRWYMEDAEYYWSLGATSCNFKAGEFWYAHIDLSTINDDSPFAYILSAKDWVYVLKNVSSSRKLVLKKESFSERKQVTENHEAASLMLSNISKLR